MFRADIATAVVLISMGAVLGRTSHNQLIIMGILEILAYCTNNWINNKYFKVNKGSEYVFVIILFSIFAKKNVKIIIINIRAYFV